MQFIVLVSRNRLIVDFLQLKKTNFAVIDDGSMTDQRQQAYIWFSELCFRDRTG